MDRAALILAAGKGTRMKSDRVKVLHLVAGRPMLAYSLDLANQLVPNNPLVVIGYQADEVKAAFAGYYPPPLWILQPEQRGTADAVRCAIPCLENSRTLVVLYGDVPLLEKNTVEALLARHEERHAPLTVLTALTPDPTGYGRVVRDDKGRFLRIVEHADAGPEEIEIREINTGIYCFDIPFLLQALHRIRPENAQQEYYLTDLVAHAVSRGFEVEWVRTEEARRTLGINTRADLAEAEKIIRQEVCLHWMLEGVSIVDPANTWIDASVTLGNDVLIEAGCHLRGATRVGSGAMLGAGSVLVDAELGRKVQVLPYTMIEQSKIPDGARLGPLMHIRHGEARLPGNSPGAPHPNRGGTET